MTLRHFKYLKQLIFKVFFLERVWLVVGSTAIASKELSVDGNLGFTSQSASPTSKNFPAITLVNLLIGFFVVTGGSLFSLDELDGD